MESMEIKILGPGCKKCHLLTQAVKDALTELDVEARVEKVEDMAQIMSYHVMGTPGLVVNDKVKVYGRVPQKAEVVEILQKEMS